MYTQFLDGLQIAFFAKYFVVWFLGKYAVPCIKSRPLNNICTFNSSHAFQHYVFLIINNIFSLIVCAQFSSKFWRVCREMCAHGSKGEEGGGGWWEVGGGGGGDVGGGVVIHFESRLRNLRIFPRPLSSHSPLVKGWFYPWVVLLLSYQALTSDTF